MSVAASLLMQRLESPDPWVRVEVAKVIASAIRAGDGELKSSFLTWIGEKALESEVANAVSLVAAFDLGAFVSDAELDAVIIAPSILSETLMRDLNPKRELRLGAFDYAPDLAEFDLDLIATFNARDGWYLPRIVSHFLQKLGRLGDLLMSRWKFEWCWLQTRQPEPFADIGALFRGDARGNHAFFQVRQTEVYASAYLRALAYALVEKGVPLETIADLALHVNAFSGGLASVEPMPRPNWSIGVTDAFSGKGLSTAADLIWREAAQSLGPGQSLLAVQSVETLALGLTSFTITLCAHPDREKPTSGDESEELDEIWIKARSDRSGSVEGAARATVPASKLQSNPALTACITPWDLARYHHDFAPQGIRLARPDMIDGDVAIAADQHGLHLGGPRGPLSTWRYWNADWSPTRPRKVPRLGGFVTSVSTAVLEAFLERRGLVTSRRCDAVVGSRDYDYGDMEIEEYRLWL
jgi:hypothetical protein